MSASPTSPFLKAVILVAVAALHIGIFIALTRIQASAKLVERGFRSQFFAVIPGKVEAIPSTRKRLRTQSAKKSPAAPDLSRAVEAAPVAIPSIDWEGQGAQAAREQVTRTPASVSAGAARDRQPTNEAEGVFNKPSHRRGDSQHLGNGEIITWTDSRNGRCYVTNQPSAVARLDERNIVTICKPASTPIDQSLFEGLKPDYLRKQP